MSMSMKDYVMVAAVLKKTGEDHPDLKDGIEKVLVGRLSGAFKSDNHRFQPDLFREAVVQ